MELGVTTKVSPLNPDLGDLALNEDGTVVVLTNLGLEVAQRLQVSFCFFKGDWFMDLEAGAPMYQRVLVKGATDRVLRSIFGQIITRTEGVQQLLRFRYNINRDRTMAIEFEALLEDGSVFRSVDYQPYIIDLQ